jgi:hypothetical protein
MHLRCILSATPPHLCAPQVSNTDRGFFPSWGYFERIPRNFCPADTVSSGLAFRSLICKVALVVCFLGNSYSISECPLISLGYSVRVMQHSDVRREQQATNVAFCGIQTTCVCASTTCITTQTGAALDWARNRRYMILRTIQTVADHCPPGRRPAVIPWTAVAGCTIPRAVIEVAIVALNRSSLLDDDVSD